MALAFRETSCAARFLIVSNWLAKLERLVLAFWFAEEKWVVELIALLILDGSEEKERPTLSSLEASGEIADATFLQTSAKSSSVLESSFFVMLGILAMELIALLTLRKLLMEESLIEEIGERPFFKLFILLPSPEKSMFPRLTDEILFKALATERMPFAL